MKPVLNVWTSALPLVLASKSRARYELLSNAGMKPDLVVPEFDERTFETLLEDETSSMKGRAMALASEKARLGSFLRPSHYVIGADQTLNCADKVFHKPGNLDEAKRQLAFLAGKTHELTSAVSVARNGQILFEHTDCAKLKMRPLTSQQIDAYCALLGGSILLSVGCYELEGLGVHLFDRVEGDFFTILGLPLEPLIDFFRREGCLSL
jgi:septum formation protein